MINKFNFIYVFTKLKLLVWLMNIKIWLKKTLNMINV